MTTLNQLTHMHLICHKRLNCTLHDFVSIAFIILSTAYDLLLTISFHTHHLRLHVDSRIYYFDNKNVSSHLQSTLLWAKQFATCYITLSNLHSTTWGRYHYHQNRKILRKHRLREFKWCGQSQKGPTTDSKI